MSNSQTSRIAASDKRYPVHAEAIFACLVLAVAFSPAARAVQLLFAPLCALLALRLIVTSPLRYVRFVMLLWFFTPFLRRVADLHAGYAEPSQILLAPILASGIAILVPLKRLACLFTKDFLPFSLALMAVTYGLMLGLLQLPAQAVITDFLKWTVPIFFALYCFTLRRDEGAESLEQVVYTTFSWSLILMAVYGIWQSFSSPPWDIYWLANVDATSFGSSERDAIRVFSTMNSPGPFACTVTGGILLLMGATGKLARIAQILGVAVVLLSQVRSAWIGLAFGLLYIFVRSSVALKLRMTAAAVLTVVLVVFGMGLSRSSDDLVKRFETLTNLKQDESAGERLAGSQRALANAFQHPLGGGMGYLDSAFLTNQDSGGSGLGNHDNGIFEFLVTLGIPGTILYAWSVLIVLSRSQSNRLRRDAAATASVAACLSFLVQLPTGNSLLGVDGFVFWLAGVLVLLRLRDAEVESRQSAATPATVSPGLTLVRHRPVTG